MIDKYATSRNDEGQGGNIYITFMSKNGSHPRVRSKQRARRRNAQRRRRRSHRRRMTSPSDQATIYHRTARVAFKTQKRVHERVVWIVSVYDNPNDIRNYDGKTMSRLGQELYGKNAKSEKMIIIREILDKKPIAKSNLTLEEHKHQQHLATT